MQDGLPSSQDVTDQTPPFDQDPQYGLLPSLTGFAIRQVNLLDFGNFLNAMGDRAITPLRYSILEIVGANPGLQQVQLAAILQLSKPATTVALDFWQERNCIERRQAIDDKRSYSISLTKTGSDTLAQLQQRVIAHDAALTSKLSADELANLRKCLRKIIHS